MNEMLERYWLRCAVREYKAAFDLSIAPDMTAVSGTHYTELISFEAGQSYLRLHTEERESLPADETSTTEVTEALAKLKSAPSHYGVSPIILSTSSTRTLNDLVDDQHRVCFDLDGDGVVESCTWVRPTTGILVWDPEHKGRIESGRDLFGNATWWLLFPDGYRALDTLDDDRDGWLTGSELTGLGVWYDFDSNGHSDPGEVFPIEATDIRGIATQWDAHEGKALRATDGLLMRDGRKLATYDWYADCLR